MERSLLIASRRDTHTTRELECDANGNLYIAGAAAAPVPVTVADGADVAQGATTDAESAVGNGTVIAILKRLRTLFTNLSHAEDAPHVSGDTGTMVLAVRRDTAPAPLAGALGDYIPLITDENGNLWVSLGTKLDHGNDSVEVWANTAPDGTGAATMPIVDAAGHLQADVRVADGADVTQGAVGDAAVITDAAGTLSGKLRGLVKWAFERMPASLGQGTMAQSLPVVVASNQSAVPVSGTFWPGTQPVSLATAPALVASEAHAGEVSVSKATVSVTPTITAGAYSALDIVGAIQTISGAARVTNGPVTLQTLTITDLGMQDANLRIFFFNQNPANGTYTDNIPLDIHDTDMGFCVGVFEVMSSDWVDAADNSVATLRNIGLGMVPVGSANLFAIAQTVGAETWASTADLVFRYHFTDR